VPQRVPESYVRSTVTARIEDRLLSIQQQILSRSRLERVIDDFNLYPEVRQKLAMEDIVDRMRTDIEGPLIERGDAFRVGYVSTDAILAQKVTQRLASLFIEENLRDRSVLAEGTNQFLDAQLEDARQRLVEHEKKLEIYRRQYAGQLPNQVDTNLQAIQTARIQFQTLAESTNRDMERRITLERQIVDLEKPDTSATDVPPPPVASVRPEELTTAEQLEAANAKLAVLELRYRPEHPDIASAKRLIRDLRARLASETPRPPAVEGTPAPPVPPVSPTEVARVNRLRQLREELTTVEAQINRRQDEQQKLRAVIQDHQARIDAAPTRESELTELMRDYDTLKNAYTSMLGKREDSKIAANLEQRQIGEQFKVLDPARVPERPFSPNRMLINLMAAVAGLALGLAWVGLLEYRDSSLRTDADVVRVLNVPVLAVVPLMRSAREIRKRRRREILMAAAGILALVASATAYAAWKLQVF
jgi:polysaccharide chain length determinant protein (PEP-CTERM system associated)